MPSAPVDPPAPASRLDLVDGLRGVALLGILLINMQGHALPFFAMWDPTVAGGTDGLNLGAWLFVETTVEGAMRGLFSLLFGVSLLLYLRGEDRARLFARRNAWLMAFGLVHGFLLLMPGDILFTYGICAFLLYPLRRAGATSLLALAALMVAAHALVEYVGALEGAALRAAAVAPGAGPDAIAAFDALREPRGPEIAWLEEAAHAGYPALLPIYAVEYAAYLGSGGIVFGIIDAMALMLIGMALHRLGAFEGRIATAGLLSWGAALAAASLAARAWTVGVLAGDGFVDNVDPLAEAVAEIARAGLAAGYALLFSGLWRIGAVGALMTPLAALGRTAFTHYIGGTLIATTLFYGHGFDLYGQFDRISVYGLIACVWIGQATFSLLWLARFRFGPLEWAWRSLVVGRPQALKRAS